MKIIAVAHQKGGVGKTTLVLNLAACFADQGIQVAVLDTDVQGSLAGIQHDLKGITFVAYNGDLSSLPSLPYQILLIDTPPYLTNQMPEVFAVADFVIVPTKVGMFDVMAIRSTLQLLKEAQQLRPVLKYGVVMNMVKPRTKLTKMVADIIGDYEVYLFTATVSDRVSYTMSAINSGIFTGEDEKAKEEISALADELLNNLGL